MQRLPPLYIAAAHRAHHSSLPETAFSSRERRERQKSIKQSSREKDGRGEGREEGGGGGRRWPRQNRYYSLGSALAPSESVAPVHIPSSSVASEFWSLFIIYLPSSTPPCFRMAVRPSGVSPYCRDVNFSMPLILRFYFLGTIDP